MDDTIFVHKVRCNYIFTKIDPTAVNVVLIFNQLCFQIAPVYKTAALVSMKSWYHIRVVS